MVRDFWHSRHREDPCQSTLSQGSQGESLCADLALESIGDPQRLRTLLAQIDAPVAQADMCL
ncbi:hypothetical protein X743_26015 [Mesorhizobium sp. LNHC252B00]|nr:hypothetical protein X743_26015 [Mesorhizobium sp. LNHC252B00]